jgi:hypothetical protein
LDIGGQASGVGISLERSQKGLQMVRDHSIEHGVARIVWDIRGWCRSQTRCHRGP